MIFFPLITNIISKDLLEQLMIAYITIFGVAISIVFGFLYSAHLTSLYNIYTMSINRRIDIIDKRNLKEGLQNKEKESKRQGIILLIWEAITIFEFILYLSVQI